MLLKSSRGTGLQAVTTAGSLAAERDKLRIKTETKTKTKMEMTTNIRMTIRLANLSTDVDEM
jgi:hypothetical protein